MQSEQFNIKITPELGEEIELVSKMLHITKVEWVRNILAHEVKKELEKHKSFIALEYMKGRISKNDLNKILGKEAEDIDFIIQETKKDFEDAKKLAKKQK